MITVFTPTIQNGKKVIVMQHAKTPKEKNLCGKTRPIDKPYQVWEGVGKAAGWQWCVLKMYQSPLKEQANPFARWFCAVYSPITRAQMSNGYELGDCYVKDIVDNAILTLNDIPKG